MVAYAIHRGTLTPDEAGPEIVELLSPQLRLLREDSAFVSTAARRVLQRSQW